MPRLFSYAMTSDSGFAPNPYYGFLTLACCKPKIRSVADVGDYVIGTYSIDKSRGGTGHVVFAMCVTKTVKFDEYSTADRFKCKKPSPNGDEIALVGDNIYSRRDSKSPWKQAASAHSNCDGSQNLEHTATDTNTDCVLISEDFAYFGGSGPELPMFGGENIRATNSSHRSNFDDITLRAFTEWFMRQDKGRRGDPTTPLDGCRPRCGHRPKPRC